MADERNPYMPPFPVEVVDRKAAIDEAASAANELLEQVLAVDSHHRSRVHATLMEWDPKLDDHVTELVKGWLRLARAVLPAFSEAEGADTLRSNIREAEGILTPDDEFFVGEALRRRTDEALRAHRAGETEPLLDDEDDIDRPWRGVCRLDHEYPTLFRVVIDTANLPQWEPHLTFNPRWVEEEAEKEPTSILEALEELRAAGGHAWDGVEDVEAYLADEE